MLHGAQGLCIYLDITVRLIKALLLHTSTDTVYFILRPRFKCSPVALPSWSRPLIRNFVRSSNQKLGTQRVNEKVTELETHSLPCVNIVIKTRIEAEISARRIHNLRRLNPSISSKNNPFAHSALGLKKEIKKRATKREQYFSEFRCDTTMCWRS
jgi:hypothetical protein